MATIDETEDSDASCRSQDISSSGRSSYSSAVIKGRSKGKEPQGATKEAARVTGHNYSSAGAELTGGLDEDRRRAENVFDDVFHKEGGSTNSDRTDVTYHRTDRRQTCVYPTISLTPKEIDSHTNRGRRYAQARGHTKIYFGL